MTNEEIEKAILERLGEGPAKFAVLHMHLRALGVEYRAVDRALQRLRKAKKARPDRKTGWSLP